MLTNYISNWNILFISREFIVAGSKLNIELFSAYTLLAVEGAKESALIFFDRRDSFLATVFLTKTPPGHALCNSGCVTFKQRFIDPCPQRL